MHTFLSDLRVQPDPEEPAVNCNSDCIKTRQNVRCCLLTVSQAFYASLLAPLVESLVKVLDGPTSEEP